MKREEISYMHPDGDQLLSDTSGYIASHENFNLERTHISSPLNSTYSISLSHSTTQYINWLYLDLIYYDITDITDCTRDSTGLVIKKQEGNQKLYRICPTSNSMPQRGIPLDSVMNINLEYEFQQKAGDQRRGFILSYKGRTFWVFDKAVPQYNTYYVLVIKLWCSGLPPDSFF